MREQASRAETALEAERERHHQTIALLGGLVTRPGLARPAASRATTPGTTDTGTATTEQENPS